MDGRRLVGVVEVLVGVGDHVGGGVGSVGRDGVAGGCHLKKNFLRGMKSGTLSEPREELKVGDLAVNKIWSDQES